MNNPGSSALHFSLLLQGNLGIKKGSGVFPEPFDSYWFSESRLSIAAAAFSSELESQTPLEPRNAATWSSQAERRSWPCLKVLR